MSHFTKVKTTFNDGVALKRALVACGHKVLGGRAVAGWLGKTVDAEFKIKAPSGGSYEIGFVKRGNRYELVSDWSMNGVNQTKFIAGLNRAYGREVVVAKLENQGFVIEKEIDRNDEIRLVMRR